MLDPIEDQEYIVIKNPNYCPRPRNNSSLKDVNNDRKFKQKPSVHWNPVTRVLQGSVATIDERDDVSSTTSGSYTVELDDMMSREYTQVWRTLKGILHLWVKDIRIDLVSNYRLTLLIHAKSNSCLACVNGWNGYFKRKYSSQIYCLCVENCVSGNVRFYLIVRVIICGTREFKGTDVLSDESTWTCSSSQCIIPQVPNLSFVLFHVHVPRGINILWTILHEVFLLMYAIQYKFDNKKKIHWIYLV